MPYKLISQAIRLKTQEKRLAVANFKLLLTSHFRTYD